MIFSYPNGIDYDLDIIDFLFDNNNITIDDIEINLNNHVKIDNNIFGHVYKNIKIKELKNCGTAKFLSTIDKNKYINTNSLLDSNENIKLIFSDDLISSIKCEIGYVYIITEPNFDDYTEYSNYRIVCGDDIELTNFDNQKSEYESKIIYYNILINKNLKKDCDEINCQLCLQKLPNNCITCKSNYTISEVEGQKRKICEHPEITDIESTFISNIITNTITNGPETTKISNTIIETEKNNKTCTNEQILNNNCNDGLMKNEQLGEVFNGLKNEIFKDDYNGENKVVQTENVVIQISTLEDQKNNSNPNISTIDLGECENILRNKHNISKDKSLLIVKTDIKSEDLSSTYVQYEVYHPVTKALLNLEICNKVKISIHVPVNLNDETSKLYDNLKESGYNLFDSSDSFYNDICTTYTSENGTDMTLEDRKKEIFSSSGNITICQIGCKLESYDKSTKKAKCNCDIQKETIETDMEKIDFSKEEIANSFLMTLKNSNFLVLQCFKLALNFKNIFKNKGKITMSVIFILFLISIIYYLFKDKNKITAYINIILKSKIHHEEYPVNSEIGKLSNSDKSKNKSSGKLKKNKKEIKDTKEKEKENESENENNKKHKHKHKHKHKEVKVEKKSHSNKDEENGPPKKKKNKEKISNKNSEHIRVNLLS